jgi:hypothetical protein
LGISVKGDGGRIGDKFYIEDRDMLSPHFFDACFNIIEKVDVGLVDILIERERGDLEVFSIELFHYVLQRVKD